MVEQNNELTLKLLHLMQRTGYQLIQHNGQRRFGPPPDWTGPPPPRGCEIFVGKLPREIFEDELVPIFSKIGKLYEMRLMMDFSGANRGYAFVTYTNKADAAKAIKELDGYEIRRRRHIGVVKSVDNSRLFVGNIPRNKSKEEVLEELNKHVTGIVDVILYKNCYDRRLNRGFAFVEFNSHKEAAMARRTLVPGCIKLWGQDVNVDWAEPEPNIEDEKMSMVKALYVRNFLIKTTPQTIQSVFEDAISAKVERVKKIYDYAFIHFFKREHAEMAMRKLQNTDIDGSTIEIKWAKPVDRELYKIQKKCRGNAKFNNYNLDLSQTMSLYDRHLQNFKKSELESQREDEGIGSACAGSECGSPTDMKLMNYSIGNDAYVLAPAKLDSMCKRYMWTPPVYEYQKYQDHLGIEYWVAKIELPHVGVPLLHTMPQRIGPIFTAPCYSIQEARIKAAELALKAIQGLHADIMQYPRSQTPLPSMYTTMISPIPSCFSLPYDYSHINRQTPLTLPTVPAIWRSV